MKAITTPNIKYIFILFQNITRAKFRVVLRNDTDVFRRFSVLFTNNSKRSPRADTFSEILKKRKKIGIRKCVI